MSRQNSKKLYRTVGSDPNAWFERAEGLFYAATTLRDQFLSIRESPPALRRVATSGLVRSSLLLLGLAVENAAKAVWIAKRPEIVSTTSFSGELFKSEGGHDLKVLVGEVLDLSSAEKSLLDRLQEHVVWAGRYPIPKKSNRYHDSRSPTNKLSMRSNSDFLTAKTLIDRMKKEADLNQP